MIGGLLQPVPAVLGVTDVMLRAGLLDDLYASYAWESQSGFVECFQKKNNQKLFAFFISSHHRRSRWLSVLRYQVRA